MRARSNRTFKQEVKKGGDRGFSRLHPLLLPPLSPPRSGRAAGAASSSGSRGALEAASGRPFFAISQFFPSNLFVRVPICDAMTVKHIVLMKFKADTPAEALEKASSNLLALKGAPPNTLARACSTAKAREEGRGSRGTLIGLLTLSLGTCAGGEPRAHGRHVRPLRPRLRMPHPRTRRLMRTACVLGKVPGIVDVTFGPTFTHDRSQGYTHALVVDLEDKAALEVFLSCSCPARSVVCRQRSAGGRRCRGCISHGAVPIWPHDPAHALLLFFPRGHNASLPSPILS